MKAKQRLSPAKRKQLAGEIQHRRNVLIKVVRSVAQGYTPAAFIWGPGGLGKSHYIKRELTDCCGKSWVHHTAFTTPKGLMLELMSAPNEVHLFEDCESMYKAQVSAEILRAACGAPKDTVRKVTYQTAHERLECRFAGGIIIVSNESLKISKGPLAAVATRFKPWQWNLTTDERICQILEIADDGFEMNGTRMTVDECRMVAAWLFDENDSGALGGGLDIRMYCEHALPAFVQYLDDPSGASWQDVLRAKLHGIIETPLNRAEKTAQLEAIAWRIYCDQTITGVKAKVAKWFAETNLGQAIYYRHLAVAKKRFDSSRPSSSTALVVVKS